MNETQPTILVVAGMPRTATTFLYQRFQEHPTIFCPYRKETNFFSVNYHKGLGWYRGLYTGIKPGQVAVDASPVYFLDRQAIDRIRSFEPRIRIILGVRPASEWALSWFTQVMSNHVGARPSLEEFVTGYALKISGGEIWQDFRNGFVRQMIDRYRQTFGDSLLLYHYRALRENPLALVNNIERFAGVPQFFSEENLNNEIVNAGSRRNIGFVADLLSREQFVDAVGRIVPRRLVQAARNAYVALSTTKEPPPPPSFTAEELEVTKSIFSEDDAWIESLFSGATMQTGSKATIFGGSENP